jgi:hypothetical protein
MDLLLRSTNWSDPKSQVTTHFTVHDATYLPTWGVYHTPSSIERAAILDLCVRLETVRALFGSPINVDCMIRPNKANCPDSPAHHGNDYNAAIGSTAKHSAHIYGQACDFVISGYSCDFVRATLVGRLADLGLRMENKPGSSWVHLDTFNPSVSGGQRFFKV